MKYIQRCWNHYVETVVPKNASATQIIECKQAFFAGILLNELVINNLSNNTTTSVGEMEFMKNLAIEIKELNAEVWRGIIAEYKAENSDEIQKRC